jgi:hypothetical protein
MKIIFFLSLFISTYCFANLHLAPPSFNVSGGRAVFSDFKTARYHFTYDVKQREVTVLSRIDFEITEEGYPIFDLVPQIDSITLNGQAVGVLTSSMPGGVSKIRMIHKKLAPGSYTMMLKNRFRKNVSFGLRGQVSSAFWIRDLKDRKFMEQYFPSNLEFDQYRMIMQIDIKSRFNRKHEIYTNGDITELKPNSWRIIFPEYYTVASPYVHLSPKGKFIRKDFSYPSIGGRSIPMTVYSRFPWRTKRFEKKARQIMKELENDYGPYAHASLIAYGAGRGGMEHSGATITSYGALDHEMLHFYFAKGIYPANGNSGWIDEAIASWRDRGYLSRPWMSFRYGGLAAHSVYKRNTDKNSYALGAEFMAYLDYTLQSSGGLKAFLSGYFAAYKHQMMTTEHFKNNLEFFSGLDLTELFRDTVYTRVEKLSIQEKNPNHEYLSDQELLDLL